MSKRGEELRSKVLIALQRRAAPMTAYELLAELQAENPRLAPTTIYRALEKLIERGAVHRLESLNAFIACQCAGHGQTPVLSICDDCGAVEETIAAKLVEQLSRVASQSGFAPTRHVVEVHGRCAACGDPENNA